MCCGQCCHLAVLEKRVIGGIGLCPAPQGFFLYGLEHSPVYVLLSGTESITLESSCGTNSSTWLQGGAGVGFVKNGTLEVNLKEQEGTFYGDEIKTRLGERQEGCSSHWLQCVESHWD